MLANVNPLKRIELFLEYEVVLNLERIFHLSDLSFGLCFLIGLETLSASFFSSGF